MGKLNILIVGKDNRQLREIGQQLHRAEEYETLDLSPNLSLNLRDMCG
jgi:hypothetical protein